MARVFLSYARQDAAKVETLAQSLEGAGHTVWWDRQIAAGTEYSGEIEQALDQAEVVVVAWSRASRQSSWVRDEAATARDSGRLIPVLLEAAAPPLGFRQLQAIDLTGWKGRVDAPDLEQLQQAVAHKAQSAPSPHAGTASLNQPLIGRFHFAVWLILPLALLIGLAVWKFQAADGLSSSQSSIAVLPFSDLSPARDNAYFAEGVSEEILGQLAREPAFRVAGRTTSWSIRNASADIEDVGRKLDVAYVLEGSVRRDEQRVRVNVALVKTADGAQLWSETYDGRLDDIFAIQRSIGSAVAESLRKRLVRSAPSGALKTRGDVYSLYLTARGMLRDREPAKARAAVELLRRAVRLDPNYAPAWSSLADAIRIKNSFEHVDEQSAEHAMAISYARRALKLSPNSAEPHFVFARLLGLGSARATPHLARAVELEPNNPEVQFSLAVTLGGRGDFAGQLRALQRAAELDPLLRSVSGMIVRNAPALGRDELAQEQIKRLERAGSPNTDHIRGHYLEATGDLSGALSEYLRARRAPEQSAGDRIDKHIGQILLSLGYPQEAQRAWGFDPGLWSLLQTGTVIPSELRKRNLTAPANSDDAAYTISAAKLMLKRGQGASLAAFLDEKEGLLPLSLGRSGESPVSVIERSPIVAQTLLQAGRRGEAERLLLVAEQHLQVISGRGLVPNWLEVKAAEIWALAGKRQQALSALERAVDRGWVYDVYGDLLGDVAEEPAFENIRSDPRFRSVRDRVQAQVDRERAEVGLVLKRAA